MLLVLKEIVVSRTSARTPSAEDFRRSPESVQMYFQGMKMPNNKEPQVVYCCSSTLEQHVFNGCT